MGSFCASGDKSTTQTNAPNPLAMSAYTDILSRAQTAASQPYQAYSGQLVAGLDPTQQAGISNINQSYGMAQPYFSQATQYAQQGAGPVANVSGADIQQYMNPYQQNVINATLGNINEADQRQQQMVKGNAAAAGALGGDRQAVAQAELARQQGLARNQTLAGLQSQGYQQALGEANVQQQNQQANAQRALSAAYGYGNLGTAAQSAQLQGAGAQLGAGQIAQQNQQAMLNAQYGQFQQQQAFPYQQLGWLAGITSPIAGSMGGTQTTTPPSPSPFSQILGLGMAGLGAVGKVARGGRIGYADGGSPYGGGSPFEPVDYSRGYIPQMQISPAQRMQFSAPPGQSQQQQQQQSGMPSSASIANAYKGGKSLYGMFAPKELGTAGTEGFSGTAGGEAAPLGINYGPGGVDAATSPGFMSSISDMFSGYAPAAAESAGEGMASLGAGAGESLGALGAGAGEAMAGAGEGLAATASEWGPVLAETAAEWGPAIAESAAEWAPMLFALVKDGGRINGRPQRRKYADGGFVDTVHAIRRGLKSYQDGGDVFDDRFGSAFAPSFEDRWAPTAAMPPMQSVPPAMAPAVRDYAAGNWSPQQVSPQAMADWRGGADLAMADQNVSPAVQLPPEITAGASRPAPQMPVDAMAYDQAAPRPPLGMQAPQQSSQGGFLGFLDSLRPKMTAEQQQGLMAAGLAMAAGQSPNPWTNIGAGGLHGLQAMAGARKEELAKVASQRNADAEARKLMHDLQRHDLEERKLKELQRQHALGEMKPIKIGQDPKTGIDIMGIPDPKGGGFKIIDSTTGQLTGQTTSTTPVVPTRGGAPATTVAGADEGIIPANAKLVQGGAYDYTQDAPYIEKGMDTPDPQPIAGRSPRAIQTDAEYYLQTGKLPPVRGGKSPVAIQQQNYRNTVQNYAGALAQSRGIDPKESAEMWRTAPGMLRFVLGADGRSTVAMGTAIRHLDTLENLYKAVQMEKSGGGDIQLINKWKAEFARQFGYPSVEALNAARSIVGTEIIKGLGVAGGGTKEERETAANSYAARLSPDQFAATKKAVQELLGGQLEGRERQAGNAGVSKERFKSLVGDRPYDLLTKSQQGGEKGGEKGEIREGKEGKKYRFKGGDRNKKENWELVE